MLIDEVLRTRFCLLVIDPTTTTYEDVLFGLRTRFKFLQYSMIQVGTKTKLINADIDLEITTLTDSTLSTERDLLVPSVSLLNKLIPRLQSKPRPYAVYVCEDIVEFWQDCGWPKTEAIFYQVHGTYIPTQPTPTPSPSVSSNR